MCGICGIVEKSGQSVDETTLRLMTDAMIHRGPDDDGYHVDQSVGLGFRRLSIVDVAHGHQPIANEDGSVWVVMNGEIYNYQELLRGLSTAGHQFRSQSDTEVVVHLYETYGIDCLTRLRGMFALAIYDAREETVYLARDYFGIKPLFYANRADRFLFSSDLKSLLASGDVDRRIELQSLWNYLTFQYVPDPFTMFSGITKVPAGHYVQVNRAKTSLHRYWQAEFQPDETKPLSWFVEGVRAKLRESVKCHLTGEVPRGAFLSSGVDSSAIAALMMQEEPVRTFSVGYEDAGGFTDELALAAETARQLGTDHHSVIVSAKQYLDHVPQVIFNQEDPLADPSAIALHFVAELASAHVTVVLSGEGADEVFGGYPIYHEPLSLRPFAYAPTRVREAMGRLATRLPHGLKGRSFLERGSVPLERRFIGNAKIFSDELKHTLLQSAYPFHAMQSSFTVTDPIYDGHRDLDDVTRMQDIDIHTWLAGDILAKADKMTMAHSLELRVPFLDRDLFEFAATIPTKYRVCGGQTKFALRQAVADLLPESVTNRPKLGFPVPLRQWLRGPMLDFVMTTFHAAAAHDYFDVSVLDDMVRQHVSQRRDRSREIWVILTFLLWHQIFMEGAFQFTPRVSPHVQMRLAQRERTITGASLTTS